MKNKTKHTHATFSRKSFPYIPLSLTTFISTVKNFWNNQNGISKEIDSPLIIQSALIWSTTFCSIFFFFEKRFSASPPESYSKEHGAKARWDQGAGVTREPSLPHLLSEQQHLGFTEVWMPGDSASHNCWTTLSAQHYFYFPHPSLPSPKTHKLTLSLNWRDP